VSRSGPGAGSGPGRGRARRHLPPPAEPQEAETAAAEPPQRRRAAFTTRAALLALVVCALVLTFAYPLRLYFAQRARINQLEAQTQVQRERVGTLTRQVKRYDSAEYVRGEARRRLHFVLPGETDYLRAGTPAPSTAKSGVDGADTGDPDQTPWYGQLWRSDTSAGRSSGKPTQPSASAAAGDGR
jgi:cell division protein FtsB